MYRGENSLRVWSKPLEKSADFKRHFTLLNVSIEALTKSIVEKKKIMCINEPYLLEREALAGRLVQCGWFNEMCEFLCAEQSKILEKKKFPTEICCDFGSDML